MTMILGYCFEDGAALIADSRLYDLKLSKPINDDVNKLSELCAGVFAGCSGYASAAEKILTRNAQRSFATHDSLIEAFREAADEEWLLVNQSAPTDLPRDQLAVGLIVGGVLNSVPFLSTIQVSNQGIESFTETEAIRCLMVAGGGDAAKVEVFNGSLKHEAGRIITSTRYDRSLRPINATIDQLLNASGNAIRAVSEKDDTVGGTIRFVVVRGECKWVAGTL